LQLGRSCDGKRRACPTIVAALHRETLGARWRTFSEYDGSGFQSRTTDHKTGRIWLGGKSSARRFPRAQQRRGRSGTLPLAFNDYGRGRGVGRGLGVGVILGTAVGVAVGVNVAVGVGLGAGVGVGARGTIA